MTGCNHRRSCRIPCSTPIPWNDMRLLAFLLAVLAAPLVQAASLHANLVPEQPLIERTRDEQRLNFDLMFQNDGDTALELAGLEVTLFDRQGRFFAQRRLDRNGDGTVDESEALGLTSWMMWDPRNLYTKAALIPQASEVVH